MTYAIGARDGNALLLSRVGNNRYIGKSSVAKGLKNNKYNSLHVLPIIIYRYTDLTIYQNYCLEYIFSTTTSGQYHQHNIKSATPSVQHQYNISTIPWVFPYATSFCLDIAFCEHYCYYIRTSLLDVFTREHHRVWIQLPENMIKTQFSSWGTPIHFCLP